MTTHAIKLTSPDELLAVVPYVLGFKPSRRIVVRGKDNKLRPVYFSATTVRSLRPSALRWRAKDL